ncbi:PHP domain-containing protein, partial [bacterium]
MAASRSRCWRSHAPTPRRCRRRWRAWRELSAKRVCAAPKCMRPFAPRGVSRTRRSTRAVPWRRWSGTAPHPIPQRSLRRICACCTNGARSLCAYAAVCRVRWVMTKLWKWPVRGAPPSAGGARAASATTTTCRPPPARCCASRAKAHAGTCWGAMRERSPSGYAELHAWSNFSFLRAAAHPEELAERAAAIGLRALALTDRDGLYGTVRLCRAARAAGLQGIVGAELSLEGGNSLVLLARTRAGYANLCRAISTAQLRGSKGDARLRWEDLEGHAGDVIALSGWPPPEDAQACAARLRALFGECAYLEIQHHLRPEDATLVRRTVALARRLRMPYVATNGVRYAVREDRQLCDVLTCVREKTTLAAAGTCLEANAEAHLKDAAAMHRLFAPYPEALRATLEIAEACTFSLDRLEGQFPSFPVPETFESAQIYLRHLVFHGARERYGSPLPREVERQIDYELGIIAKFDLAGYFLVVWDIVQAAHRLDVLCQGRGSAANSAVCYCLG